MRHRSAWMRCLFCTCLSTLAAVSTPQADQQRAVTAEVYRLDFESGLDAVAVIGPSVTITENPAEVIEGTRSLKLEGIGAALVLRPERFPLVPLKVYVIEYKYRSLTSGGPLALGVGFYKVAASGEGFYIPLRGPVSATTDVESDARSAQAGAGGDAFVFHVWDRGVVIDDIRILQHDVEARAPAPLVIDTGFPRLANYMLLAPDTIALINATPQRAVEDIASRYDLMMGSSFNHTLGAAAWVGTLHEKNPGLRILPYKQAFMAQFETGIEGSGLLSQFNGGLQPNWFLRTPLGEQIGEPAFPQNVQLKHTEYGSSTDAAMLSGYTADFLHDSVLSSGLWSGIHFDQPEWYVNPLLGTPAPAIDLDDNGVAEPTPLVQYAWAQGFVNYFATMAKRLGTGTLLYGNAGHIPGNTTMLPRLNGWQGEVISPYPILPGGDWNTNEPSEWYRLLDNYRLATTFARAPQIVSLQFTGRELGVQTGGVTPNGYPQRLPVLEFRDFRRMRLGLTTALLGNGFFEYDYVDNTTVPLWFDEYAVDANGEATTALSGKGYLGQPLGASAELPYASRVVFALDFESATTPAGVTLGPGRISTEAAEIVSGTASFVASRHDANSPDPVFSAWVPLVPGQTYQLFADYKILEYQPTTFAGFIGLGFRGDDGSMSVSRAASLFLPDVSGPGQQGTLRAVIKATRSDIAVVAGLTDLGTIALDNVRLLETTGNVWRRDFENGIALVNPTPEPLYVTQADVAGPRNRRGIKRILGSQVPQWNDGSAVTSGLWIGPGDGIVLLADHLAAATPPMPHGAVVIPNADGITLAWARDEASVAGYLIRYGENTNALTRHAAAGPTAWAQLTDVTPGVGYIARITAHDFRGTEGPPLDVPFTVAGTAPDRPVFTMSAQSPALAAGSIGMLEGNRLADGTAAATTSALPLSLAGARVEVNGVPAALLSVSPNQVSFVTPWQVAGSEGVVTVTRNGVKSADRVVPIVAARPWMLTWSGGDISIASHEDGTLVSAPSPAAPGSVVNLLAAGLGPVRPHPDAGQPPSPQHPARVTGSIEVRIGGLTAEVIGGWLLGNQAALYGVRVRVPPGLAPGLHPIELAVDGEHANAVRIPVQ